LITNESGGQPHSCIFKSTEFLVNPGHAAFIDTSNILQGVIIYSSDNNRIFRVIGGETANLATRSLTLTRGMEIAGGAIANFGTLTLNSTTVSSSSAGWAGGGGIHTVGRAMLNNVTINGNTSSGSGGGGIYNTGFLDLNHATFANNNSLTSSSPIRCWCHPATTTAAPSPPTSLSVTARIPKSRRITN
jgi:hypothetical protein